jgi:hypothetical protein
MPQERTHGCNFNSCSQNGNSTIQVPAFSMSDDHFSFDSSSVLSVPFAASPVLVHNKFVISPPIDRFRLAPIVHMLSDSLDLTYCPKCNHIMLPTLFCDHCRLQFAQRLIDFESRLVRVNSGGEMERSTSSGSQVRGVSFESFDFENADCLSFIRFF